MVLVRFDYLRSDSERKLLIGQFNLTHVKLESRDMFKNCPGCQQVIEELLFAQTSDKICQDICKDTESNLGPFAGFQG